MTRFLRLDQHFRRAEKLAGSGNYSRAYTLGWIMNRLRFPQRSIPLLTAAIETAKDKEAKERSTFALLESFLDTGDWKAGEAMFLEATQQLAAREIQQWHSRLALIAAKDGFQGRRSAFMAPHGESEPDKCEWPDTTGQFRAPR